MIVLRMLEANTDAMENFVDATHERAATLYRKVIDATRKNLELGFDFVGSLSRARTLSEVVESQATYSRKQIDAITAQADEIRKCLFYIGVPESQTSASPLQHTEKAHFKARERSPTRHNAPEGTAAVPEKRIKTQKFEAPSPPKIAVGSETEPETQKGKALKANSTPHQKVTTRDAVAGEGKQRPETVTKVKGPLSPDKVIQDDAETAPIPPELPIGIKFGMLDGKPVRFTESEAWWLVDGTWRRSSSDEVVPNVVEMRKARFDHLFPRVPPLPSNAFTGLAVHPR